MKIRLDNILLGILWLLAVTLGASFWFNTVFGFNIFSASHWTYLSELQASKNSISPTFYISFVICVFIMIFGLYILIRPRLRRIQLPKVHIEKHKNNTPIIESKETKNNADASTLDLLPAETAKAPTATQPSLAPIPSARPPRLNIPVNNTGYVSATQTNTITPVSQPKPQSQENPEIQEIFSKAGFTVKKSPRINGITPALFAIGSNETLWVGGVGIKTTDIRNMIDKLSQIFSDTLEDIYIDTNGFVINAPDAATSEFENILMFNTIEELRNYINNNPNPPITEEDKDNFAAYSEYIDTVISYIGKI